MTEQQQYSNSGTIMKNEKKYSTWESLPDTLTALHISQYRGISRRRVYELFQTHAENGAIQNFAIGASKMF